SYASGIRALRAEVGELVAKHDRAGSFADFAKYRDDPNGFIRDVLKGEPWAAQVEIAENVRDHPRVVVRSCNGAGKDWLAARLALWAAVARRALVLITGPVERQVREIVFGEIKRAFHRNPDLPGELYEQALKFGRSETAGIIGFTSTSASRLTGHHAPAVFVIITEAQGVEPFAWEGMLACATGEDSRILAVGNPLQPTGRFYQVSRLATWKSFRISAEDHPNVREGREVIPGAITPAFVETMASEYGRGSGVFAARVLGEFPDEADDTLCRRSWLEAAAVRWRKAEGRGVGLYVLAVDPARYGMDQTVLAVRRGAVVERIVAWAKKDTMETVGRVSEALAELPAGRRLVVDEVGIGAGVVDRLRERGAGPLPFNGGRRPRDPNRFANTRAECFWALRKLLENGEIALPHDEKLFDELALMRWRTNSAGKVMIEPKDRLKERIGRSPDRADAVAMAFWWVADRQERRPRSGTRTYVTV
ncbi:MAG TPA: hypothetical protein VM737_11610, partial [Gemmatimonadota bacterium]|nr:hypothetical protein [Gemmatimonadota bacterium]